MLQIADAFGVTLVEGVLSHQLKRFIIDGNKCVLNRPLPDAKAEDATFEENEVYGIDIVVSTGDGKSRVMDEKDTMVRCTVQPWLGCMRNRHVQSTKHAIASFAKQRQVASHG